MTFEIHADKVGNPYLKRVDRFRNVSAEGRGQWVDIGRSTDYGIEKAIRANEMQGYLVLPDEFGVYRVLILTE